MSVSSFDLILEHRERNGLLFVKCVTCKSAEICGVS